jgi:hypothetical protein
VKLTEEKLRHLQQFTHLSEAAAREALEWANGDELEALEWLEQEGRIPAGSLGFYSTAEEGRQQKGTIVTVPGRRRAQKVSDTPLTWGERVWLFLVGNRLVAHKVEDPARRIECPLGALLALLVIAWYAVAAVLALGFALGWRYRLEGPQLGEEHLRELLARFLSWLSRREGE